MKFLRLFFQKTHYFWVSTRFIFIILFLWTAVEIMDYENSEDLVISGVILLYTLFILDLAIRDLLKKPSSIWIKKFVGGFSIFYGLLLAFLMLQTSSEGLFDNISFILLALWPILYGIWEIPKKKESIRKFRHPISMKIKYSILGGLLFAVIMFIYLAITSKIGIAIFVSVFVILISPFILYWKIFSRIKFTGAFQKINTKQVIYSGMASDYKDGIAVGGTLYLLSDRLVFQTNTINFMLRHEQVIPFNQITEVDFAKTMGLIDNGLLIKMENNTSEKFVVYKRENWKQEIEKCLVK